MCFYFPFSTNLNENKWLDSEMFLILALQPRQPPEVGLGEESDQDEKSADWGE